ncbi:Neurotransmitter-gated ion-channel ligand binding domain protein [Aphelenchoides fujianensis]|nr:Neurotransmitter-gated ion-channel ligand binding domain protein [Aphelenchoides fujianensis]
MHTFRTLLFFLLVVPLAFEAKVDVQREIENRLFRNYDRRHRPVKDQSTTTNIHMFLVVNHIESVDEVEQTMLVHGTLWAVWMDEYLTWDPKAYNDTNTLSIQPWKIWQPALSLYNAARSNSWYLYFNGKPHVVTSNGFVSAMGTFSFSITCNFDYSDFPNDKQECPIVLTDWIYDLSKVNLTTGIGNYVRSMIKLSGNPFEETEKRHLGGGPSGC